MPAKIPTYVASPYGFAASTKHWYDTVFIPLVERYVEVRDPWKVPVDHILSAGSKDRPELWIKHGEHHLDTISGVKLVVAGLDQEPPDVGTVGEIFWAAAKGIPVIGYRGDLRTSGEDGLKYNLMIGAVIRRSGGVEVSTLEELEAALKRFTS